MFVVLCCVCCVRMCVFAVCTLSVGRSIGRSLRAAATTTTAPTTRLLGSKVRAYLHTFARTDKRKHHTRAQCICYVVYVCVFVWREQRNLVVIVVGVAVDRRRHAVDVIFIKIHTHTLTHASRINTFLYGKCDYATMQQRQRRQRRLPSVVRCTLCSCTRIWSMLPSMLALYISTLLTSRFRSTRSPV